MARLLLTLLAVVGVLSACGGGSDGGGSAPAPPQPAAAATADVPSVHGKTMNELIAGLPEGAILNVSSYSGQRVGRNRLGFAIVDRANKQIDVSEVAVYTAKPDGTDLRGPFTACFGIDAGVNKRELDIPQAISARKKIERLKNKTDLAIPNARQLIVTHG